MFVEITSGDYLNSEHIVLVYATGSGSSWVVQATVAENALTSGGNTVNLLGSFTSQALAQAAVRTLFGRVAATARGTNSS